MSFSLMVPGLLPAQPATDPFLEKLLKKHKTELAGVTGDPAGLEIQVMYTRIDRNSRNEPAFTTYKYRVDPEKYFYPASTVKLPVVLLALEKLNDLRITGLTRDTPMLTGADRPAQTAVTADSTSESGLPSVAHYVKKILLASDNDAFNRLYEFLGPGYINETLQAKGYTHTRITHRLGRPLPAEENRHTNPVRFELDGKTIYIQPGRYTDKTYSRTGPVPKGKGYLDNGRLIQQPFDFREKNEMALEDQHALLRAIFFPHSVAPARRFNLSEDDYRFLYQYMSQLPVETSYPQAYTEMDDNAVKFLLFGNSKRRMPRHIRSYNKIGKAYGYLTDNAYLVDFERGVELMLSATIYCNSDGIFNDDRYDYETVGLPFMANLGKIIFDYELERRKKNRPDLDRFEVEYDK